MKRAITHISLASLTSLLRLPENVHIQVMLQDYEDLVCGRATVILSGEGLPAGTEHDDGEPPVQVNLECSETGKTMPAWNTYVRVLKEPQ